MPGPTASGSDPVNDETTRTIETRSVTAHQDNSQHSNSENNSTTNSSAVQQIQHNMAACQMNIPMKPFNGSDPEIWLDKFEQTVKYKKLDEDQALHYFRLLLDGMAENWYQGVSADNKSTYALLKAEFEKRFIPDEDEVWRYIELFQDRKQNEGEKVDEYVDDKRRLAQKAKQPDDFLMASVIHGFVAYIRKYIMEQPQGPKTLQEAVRMARIKQASQQQHDTSTQGLNIKTELQIRDIISSQSKETESNIKDLVTSVKEVLTLQQTASVNATHIHGHTAMTQQPQYQLPQQRYVDEQQQQQQSQCSHTQYANAQQQFNAQHQQPQYTDNYPRHQQRFSVPSSQYNNRGHNQYHIGHNRHPQRSQTRPNNSRQNNFTNNQQSGSRPEHGNDQCFRCGKYNHHYSQCHYAHATCHRCSRVGHLQYMCSTKLSQSGKGQV